MTNQDSQIIQLFSKEIDYDKNFYEQYFGKNGDGTKKPIEKTLPVMSKKKPLFTTNKQLKIGKESSPVLLHHKIEWNAYAIYCTNFMNYDADELMDLFSKFGHFLCIRELDNKDIKVTYQTEEEGLVCYKELKKDERYRVRLMQDEGEQSNNDRTKKRVKENGFRRVRVIDAWVNGNTELVEVESSKQNLFPVQIFNFQRLKHEQLKELFSEYGKFISITELDNNWIQVRYCTEDSARNFVKDMKKDSRFKVRILFSLRSLYDKYKLCKNVSAASEIASVEAVIALEEKVKYDYTRNKVLTTKKVRKKKEDNETLTEGVRVIYVATRGSSSPTIYTKGKPLHNPYIHPPYSYIARRYQQLYMPVPSQEEFELSQATTIDPNFEYFKEAIMGLKENNNQYCEVKPNKATVDSFNLPPVLFEQMKISESNSHQVDYENSSQDSMSPTFPRGFRRCLPTANCSSPSLRPASYSSPDKSVTSFLSIDR